LFPTGLPRCASPSTPIPFADLGGLHFEGFADLTVPRGTTS
jgi:hypothetical protein